MMHTKFAVAIAVMVFGATLLLRNSRPDWFAVEREQIVQTKAIDLTDTGTTRGPQDSYSPIALSLPRALVRLTLVLPRFSESGRYSVSLSQGRTREDVITRVDGVASMGPSGMQMTITIDLRKFKQGSYFLATAHDQDDAYYYPVVVQ